MPIGDKTERKHWATAQTCDLNLNSIDWRVHPHCHPTRGSDSARLIGECQPQNRYLRTSGSRQRMRRWCRGWVRRRRWRTINYPTSLQLREHLGEKPRLGVDPQHVKRQTVDNQQASVPKLILGIFYEERLERVGDLVAHVRVGEVEAGENDGLQLLRARDAVAVD